MNLRIKELAEQAGFRSNPDIYDRNQSFDMEKFAELIVRECAELIDNKVMMAQTYDAFFVAKYDTKAQCAKQIREHFGIEE